MVAEVRAIDAALGDGHKVPQASELDTRRAARQQVIALHPVARGETVRRDQLGTARCGGGLPPSELWSLVGTVATQDQAAGEPWRS
jgi:N-acetylneuraminate synthase